MMLLLLLLDYDKSRVIYVWQTKYYLVFLALKVKASRTSKEMNMKVQRQEKVNIATTVKV